MRRNEIPPQHFLDCRKFNNVLEICKSYLNYYSKLPFPLNKILIKEKNMLEYGTADIFLYVLFCLVIIPLGLVIGRKLYIDTRNEEHKENGKVIQRIIKNYCVVQCGVWPLICIMFGIIKFTRNSLFIYNHKTLVIIIVSCFRSLLRLNLGYVGFHSFATATCRYVFMMYATHDYTSVRKIRKFFNIMSFMVPIY